MTEQAQQLAVQQGAAATDAAAHRARLLTHSHLDESDLVLAMAREHRSHTVQLSPAALHRAFTVREFARLAATLSDDDVRRGVMAAGADAGHACVSSRASSPGSAASFLQPPMRTM